MSKFKAVGKAHQSSSLSPISVDPIIDSAKLIHGANNEAGGIFCESLRHCCPVLFCHGLLVDTLWRKNFVCRSVLLGEVVAVAIGQGQTFFASRIMMVKVSIIAIIDSSRLIVFVSFFDYLILRKISFKHKANSKIKAENMKN